MRSGGSKTRRLRPGSCPRETALQISATRAAKMKIRLIMLGKTRREEARSLIDDYVDRIQNYADTEIIELRDTGPAALRKLKTDPGLDGRPARRRRKTIHVATIRPLAGRPARPRHARTRLPLRRRRRLPRRNPRQRQTENLALHADHAPRIRARITGRANLSRLRHPRRPSLPEMSNYVIRSRVFATRSRP